MHRYGTNQISINFTYIKQPKGRKAKTDHRRRKHTARQQAVLEVRTRLLEYKIEELEMDAEIAAMEAEELEDWEDYMREPLPSLDYDDFDKVVDMNDSFDDCRLYDDLL